MIRSDNSGLIEPIWSFFSFYSISFHFDNYCKKQNKFDPEKQAETPSPTEVTQTIFLHFLLLTNTFLIRFFFHVSAFDDSGDIIYYWWNKEIKPDILLLNHVFRKFFRKSGRQAVRSPFMGSFRNSLQKALKREGFLVISTLCGKHQWVFFLCPCNLQLLLSIIRAYSLMIEAIVNYKVIFPYDWSNCQLYGHTIPLWLKQ